VNKPNGLLKPDRDVRGLIASIAIIGALTTLNLLIVKGEIDGPIALAFLGTLSGPVLGFYYGGKGGTGTEAQYVQGATQMAQGIQLSEIHDLVNSRLTAVTDRLDKALGLMTGAQMTEMNREDKPRKGKP